jgi:peptide/nickel transport system ATP-binding protein
MLIAAVPSLVPSIAIRSRAVVLADQRHVQDLCAARLVRAPTTCRGRGTDVTLSIRQGETLGIVGESGSGKSTVARCIARLVEPSSGRIVIGDTDFAAISRRTHALRARVQIVFQDPYRSLNPAPHGGAAIIEGPMNYGCRREDALNRARTLMDLVRLEPQSLDRFPHQFSGASGNASASPAHWQWSRSLLIADEAVSALDVSVQAQVLALLDEIRQR